MTHQRLRRDFPYPGDCAYVALRPFWSSFGACVEVFNEGEDAGESVLRLGSTRIRAVSMRLCSGNGHLVDLLKVFCVPAACRAGCHSKKSLG